MGMNVNLPPELEMLVRRKVASGMYTSASEVVREAFRLMGEQDQMRAVRLDQLRQDVRKGLDSGPSEGWDPDAMKQQARSRRAAAKGSPKAYLRGDPSPATGCGRHCGNLGSHRR